MAKLLFLPSELMLCIKLTKTFRQSIPQKYHSNYLGINFVENMKYSKVYKNGTFPALDADEPSCKIGL